MNEHRDPIGVFLPLDRESDWQVGTELSNEELQLIGLITIQWANLEHSLYVRTLMVAEQLNIDAPKDAESTLFEDRLKALRSLAKKLKTDEKETLIKLADKITNIKDYRHKITHGLWDWNRYSPEKLTTFSFRPKYCYELPYDVKKLKKLIDRIGEVIFKLNFPNGIMDLEMIPAKRRDPGTIVKIDPNTIEKLNKKN